MNNDEEEDFTDQYVPTKEIIDDDTLHLSYCLITRQWLKERQGCGAEAGAHPFRGAGGGWL